MEDNKDTKQWVVKPLTQEFTVSNKQQIDIITAELPPCFVKVSLQNLCMKWGTNTLSKQLVAHG